MLKKQTQESGSGLREVQSMTNTVRGGFTLIELLIVVGIIAVLAAMALLVTARIRESGRELRCTNNLAQLHRAGIAYANDWGGRLCPTVDPVSNGDLWTKELPNYLGTTSLSTSAGPGATQNQVVWRGVVGCPTARIQHGGEAADGTYGQNASISGYNRKLGSLKQPASTVFFGDGFFAYWATVPYWVGMIGTSRMPDSPHGKNDYARFVYFDGHGQRMPGASVPTSSGSSFWSL
jgi:prepilin-type N-terminal cleavage/methylation domain-containing protein